MKHSSYSSSVEEVTEMFISPLVFSISVTSCSGSYRHLEEWGGGLSCRVCPYRGRGCNLQVLVASVFFSISPMASSTPFSVTIQGPAPLCELSQHQVQSTTKIESLRLAVAHHYDYSNPADIDLRSRDQILLANKTLGHYNITDSDLLVVAERISKLTK